MITVDDKLKNFSEKIIKEVKKESEVKLHEFEIKNKVFLEEEKTNIMKESEEIVNEAKKKAQTEKYQIISKAEMDRQYVVLSKKKEIYERVVDDIKQKAAVFTTEEPYENYLKACIDNVVSQFKTYEITLIFRQADIDRYQAAINGYLKKYNDKSYKITVSSTEDDIIGGCIGVNMENTLRVDNSMMSMIEDKQELIGKILMENLS